MDFLLDRDCVILDGACNCLKPFEDCKYLQEKPDGQQNNRDAPHEGANEK